MLYISDLDTVSDLAQGHFAYPEPDVTYDVRRIDGKPIGVRVEKVERRGGDLYAIAGAAFFRVTGRPCEWVLVPTVHHS